jgi:phytoene dehydrogenase-like protein
MTQNSSHEIVVIGGGPAGVTAALRARELGAAVALVERGNMGGTCTNDGCVPTRVLAHAARLVRDAEQFSDYGLEGEAAAGGLRPALEPDPAYRLRGPGEKTTARTPGAAGVTCSTKPPTPASWTGARSR